MIEDLLFLGVAAALFGASYYCMFMKKTTVSRDEVLQRMAKAEEDGQRIRNQIDKEIDQRVKDAEAKAIAQSSKGNRRGRANIVPPTKQEIAVKILQEEFQKIEDAQKQALKEEKKQERQARAEAMR